MLHNVQPVGHKLKVSLLTVAKMQSIKVTKFLLIKIILWQGLKPHKVCVENSMVGIDASKQKQKTKLVSDHSSRTLTNYMYKMLGGCGQADSYQVLAFEMPSSELMSSNSISLILQ